jgi:hypothetical protein
MTRSHERTLLRRWESHDSIAAVLSISRIAMLLSRNVIETPGQLQHAA